ncbi:MAG: DUF6328 family protein [Ilumatobacter sp.]|uniref:DUF6328 family protein n=1 Tax=Ilumatobacter sp. TaxID=1967498 RepID=UPI003C72BEA4
MTADSDTPDEATDSKVDQEFRSLLEGLRTSLPAVQVLFAFLLTAPLQSAFDDFVRIERVSFAIAFYTSGAASVLLIAPSIHQRVRAPSSGLRRRSKSHLIWATWLTIVGSMLAGVAVLAVIFLVSHVVYGLSASLIATSLLALVVGWSWIYVPLVTFRRTG